MALKGFTRNFKPLEILTEEEVEAIHRGTLEVLWVTGVRFESDWALDFLEKNGCKVDRDEKRVRFPQGLVEECLRQCPSSFHVKARDPKNDLMLGGNTLYLKSSAGMETISLDSYEPRAPTKVEYADYVRVLDALPNFHLFGPYPYFGFEGVPPVMRIPEGVALKFKYSSKHQNTAYSQDCEIFNIEMAQAVGTEILGGMAASPPLTWAEDAVWEARRMIEAGFPVRTTDGDILGATAPATYAGSVIISNAEHISMMVLIQLLHPGHRFMVTHLDYPQNMRSGSPGFGQIGVSISNVIFNQMWRRYGIPFGDDSPGYPCGKVMDYQTGYEKAIAGVFSAISGANTMSFYGGVSSELSAHPIQAILDDDIAGMVGRFLQGVKVDYETLAIDLIEEVGPIPGHFLNKEHTRRWWKLEQFVPKAADRLTYPEWMQTGKKTCLDYAKERMEEILATHKATPLTPGQEKDVERILEEARNYYRKKELISEGEMATYRESMKSPNYPFGIG